MENSNQSSSDKKSNPAVLIILVIIIVAIIGYGVWQSTNKKDNKQNNSTTVSTTIETTESTTQITTESTTETVNWQDLYHSKLNELDPNLPIAEYSLYNINGDNIPELIIDYGTCEADRVTEFYTVKSNELINLGSEYSGNCRIEVVDGILYLNLMHMGYQEVRQITISESNIKSETIYKTTEEQDDYKYFGDFLEMYELDSPYTPFSQFKEK